MKSSEYYKIIDQWALKSLLGKASMKKLEKKPYRVRFGGKKKSIKTSRKAFTKPFK